MKNVNQTHTDTLRSLQIVIAELVLEKERRQAQLECLQIAKSTFENQKNWIRVREIAKSISTFEIDIADREAYISMQSDEYMRLKAKSEGENLVETYLLKNPQLQHA